MRRLIGLAAIGCCSLATVEAAPSAQPAMYAAASFEAELGNDCTVTTATIEVADGLVTFHWDVYGQPLDPGCDGLWYYFIDGEAPLNPGEFTAASNRRSATLEKTMSVRDDEGGTTFDLQISVRWTREPGEDLKAEMRISAPQIGTQWTDDPLASTTAVLSRVRNRG
jgi:hypothetical protein